MRIAILTPTFSGFSGPDRVVWNEADELSEKNDVSIFCFKADMKHPKARLVVLGAPGNATLERVYKLLFFLNVFRVIAIVKRLRGYDGVISFLYPMTFPAAIARIVYKTRYTYYDVGLAPSGIFKGFFERAYMSAVKLLTKLTVANADDAVSISRYCSEELRKSTKLRSIVKYVAIEKKRFSKINKNKIAAVKKKYGLEKPTLLYVGRISPHKGIHLLLKAFNIVKKKFPKARLLVVGKHTFGNYSQQMGKKTGSDVIFTGFIPDEALPYFYGACDLYVTASLWEGFDMPAVEAQYSGKKVVAFDTGSHKEVVKTGLLVKKGDVEAFADAIIKMLR